MVARGHHEACSSLRPALPGVAEVFHATFVEHRYPRHCHDTWTVLIIDDGAIAYELDGRQRAAGRQQVTILPPFVAHDGHSAQPGRAFRKRVLYVDGDRLPEELIGAAVDRSAITDPQLARPIAALHQTFAHPSDDLEQETMLHDVLARIARALSRAPELPGGPACTGVRRSSDAAEALKAELDSHPFARHRLDDTADRLGWSATHLIRSFTAAFGLPPHRYLISRRVDEARRRLLAGMPPARVAVDVGFHDQAHLARHFKTHLGVTPSRFALGS